MLVAHHGHVIKAVHVRQRLNECFVLSQFLSATVQQTDVWVGTLHHFTIQFKHQTQHTVCGGVLGTKVQGVVFNFSHDYFAPPY